MIFCETNVVLMFGFLLVYCFDKRHCSIVVFGLIFIAVIIIVRVNVFMFDVEACRMLLQPMQSTQLPTTKLAVDCDILT